jgi:hypothetical protein
MGSFRDFMRQPQKVEAVSVCRTCGKPIEKRGQIWYATGEGVRSDLCLKSRSGDHKPVGKGHRVSTPSHATALHDRPLAARGLTSYRIPDRYGSYVMIGAKDHKDAMREAKRSTPNPKREDLEVWDGEKYVKAHATIRTEDPTYLIVWNYADDGQKFWNGRRWVSDASDATTYSAKKARSAYEQVAGKAGHENISLVEDYGLESERVAISGY